MTHELVLDVPEELYQALASRAAAAGHRIEDVVLEFLQPATLGKINLSEEEKQRRRERLEHSFGAVNSGDPDSSNNQRIDADLAREYARGLGKAAP